MKKINIQNDLLYRIQKMRPPRPATWPTRQCATRFLAMKRSLLALALGALLGLAGPGAPLVAAKIDPNDKGEPLFPDGHPNITYLTDENWDEHLAKTDKPWLIDFYHPLCVVAALIAGCYWWREGDGDSRCAAAARTASTSRRRTLSWRPTSRSAETSTWAR